MSAARVCKEQSDYVKCSRASRDSCSSPQQLRLSRCLRTCCRLLGACEWVALRPRLRCLLKVKERYVATEVTSVDAAAFLEAQLAASAFVAIKIDVEGYEYTLLPWLYQHNASLLCRLNLVVIEWHERMMPAHRGETNRLTRLMESPSCRLPVVPWH